MGWFWLFAIQPAITIPPRFTLTLFSLAPCRGEGEGVGGSLCTSESAWSNNATLLRGHQLLWFCNTYLLGGKPSLQVPNWEKSDGVTWAPPPRTLPESVPSTPDVSRVPRPISSPLNAQIYHAHPASSLLCTQRGASTPWTVIVLTIPSTWTPIDHSFFQVLSTSGPVTIMALRSDFISTVHQPIRLPCSRQVHVSFISQFH